MSQLPDQSTTSLDDRLGNLESELASVLNGLHDEIDVSILSGDSNLTDSFRLIKLLSGSGQAFVFLARDLELDRNVVIKIYRRQLPEQQRSRVLKEARSLAKIDSPYVARCLSVNQHHDTPFLVMEYIEGESLDKFARRTRPSPETSLQLVCQIAKGVQAAHAENVLHLDLKPTNVMVTQEGVPKIIDFGMARETRDAEADDFSGTPSFLAPERLKGATSPVGPHTDVFGLGGTMYYLLTGKSPFRGESIEEVLTAVQAGEIEDPQHWVPSIPNSISELCKNSLQPMLSRRLQTVDEFLKDAHHILKPGADRSQISIAMILVGLLLLATLVAYNVSQSGVAGPQMPIPSAMSIGNMQETKLPMDIPLNWQISTGDGLDRKTASPNALGVFELPLGEEIHLRVAPDETCWLALFQYESVEDQPELSCTLVTPKHDELDSRYNEALPLELSFTTNLTPDGYTEYLYLVGSSSKWNPQQVERTDELTVEKLRAFQNGGRGLTEKNRLSCVRIPFRVITGDQEPIVD